MRIDNQQFASRNRMVGYILAPLAAASVVGSLVFGRSGAVDSASVLYATSIVPVLFIIYMGIVMARRRSLVAVQWIELDNEFKVGWQEQVETIPLTEIRRMEYAGLRNPARAAVLHAPFPANEDRLLIITLADGREVCVRVARAYDEELKRIALKLR